MGKAQNTIRMLGSFALVLLAVSAAGSIVRGEWSPWIWEELESRHVAPSFADQLVTVLWYVAFYSVGFLIPYWLTTFVLFMARHHAAGLNEVPPMPINHRSGRLFLSLSTLVLFLLLMDSIVAFVRALPTEEWNGWLLISGLATAALFAYLAYLAFRRTGNHQST
ncbi:MAG: hypothetical protein LAO30_19320 [Acidobacteriia bacterium]|nr:hypothetical protein [Terriglobia bacterium]